MKKNKGITLIALVITIIILIILAGVSISVLFNQEGIITKAKKAKEDYANAQNEEAKTIGTLINSIDGNINEETGSTSSELKYWEYTTTNDGKIILSKYIGTNPEVIVKEKYKVNDKQYSTVMKKTNHSIAPTVVMDGPFINNENIEKVVFEDNITFESNSMNYVFSKCVKLKEVINIPNSIEYMVGTFEECSSLEVMPIIPGNVKYIGIIFYKCTALKEVTKIPSSVLDMHQAFDNCILLENPPEIPEKVVNMQSTFEGCKKLSKAPVIPSKVINMSDTFNTCVSLTEAPEIPANVINMSGIFQGCISLKAAPKIPEKVQDLKYAFQNCVLLKTAPEIPESVTNLMRTFYGCTALKGTINIKSTQVSVADDIVYNTKGYEEKTNTYLTIKTPGIDTTTYKTISKEAYAGQYFTVE